MDVHDVCGWQTVAVAVPQKSRKYPPSYLGPLFLRRLILQETAQNRYDRFLLTFLDGRSIIFLRS